MLLYIVNSALESEEVCTEAKKEALELLSRTALDKAEVGQGLA